MSHGSDDYESHVYHNELAPVGDYEISLDYVERWEADSSEPHTSATVTCTGDASRIDFDMYFEDNPDENECQSVNGLNWPTKLCKEEVEQLIQDFGRTEDHRGFRSIPILKYKPSEAALGLTAPPEGPIIGRQKTGADFDDVAADAYENLVTFGERQMLIWQNGRAYGAVEDHLRLMCNNDISIFEGPAEHLMKRSIAVRHAAQLAVALETFEAVYQQYYNWEPSQFRSLAVRS